MSTGPETEHVCVLVYGGFSGDAVEGDLISIDPGECTSAVPPHLTPCGYIALSIQHIIQSFVKRLWQGCRRVHVFRQLLCCVHSQTHAVFDWMQTA